MNYNDQSTNIAVQHPEIANKLSRRLIQLRAARTLWHKDMNQFMDHILRVNDDGLSYDVFPWIIGRVRKGEKSSQPVSMGACQEFMPVVLRFLHSDRDEHLHIALVMVQSLLERFWDQLLQMSRNHLTSCQSGNLESLYMILVTTVERVRQLTSCKSPEVNKEATAAYALLEKL
ncbi:KATNB1-like protein 1 [Bolinopsis microptera]|uniref:KATNB1-like protein 1 n=1 Tax=Bolinopsis microptera TaxID=2820187 RepID=UPI00307A9089